MRLIRAAMSRRVVGAVTVLVAGAFLVIGVSAAAAGTSRAAAAAIWVSPSGTPSGAGVSCDTAKYSHIQDGVAAAPAGGTVNVCHGTYAEDVLVSKPLSLIGPAATINAAGLENGIQVVASNVMISGFRVVDANGEGILVGIDSFADIGLLPASGPVLMNVRIEHVQALNNDKGFNGTEEGNCKYPGDCGGGIHLNVTEHSSVTNSQASGNADGILLTDDYGPNAYNLVEHDLVSNNLTECGIVLPSHSSNAVTFDAGFHVTGRNPDQGGVYDNRVLNNMVLNNGTATAPAQFGGRGGSGSGIGIFGSGPGSGAYDNLVQGNYIAGSGLAGVAIHAHHPGGEDVNGNQIVGNTFDTNNVKGDTFDGGVSDFDTTAIAVYSVPAVQMTISGNTIRNNRIGIWLTNTVQPTGLNTNTFVNVVYPVVFRPAN
jgi:parallel beta-helix repeat protein